MLNWPNCDPLNELLKKPLIIIWQLNFGGQTDRFYSDFGKMIPLVNRQTGLHNRHLKTISKMSINCVDNYRLQRKALHVEQPVQV